MKKIDVILFGLLLLLSLLMVFNLVSAYFLWTFAFFTNWIHFVFYGFAAIVPLYYFVQWWKIKSTKRFLTFFLALLPGILFLIWFAIMISSFPSFD